MNPNRILADDVDGVVVEVRGESMVVTFLAHNHPSAPPTIIMPFDLANALHEGLCRALKFVAQTQKATEVGATQSEANA